MVKKKKQPLFSFIKNFLFLECVLKLSLFPLLLSLLNLVHKCHSSLVCLKNTLPWGREYDSFRKSAPTTCKARALEDNPQGQCRPECCVSVDRLALYF